MLQCSLLSSNRTRSIIIDLFFSLMSSLRCRCSQHFLDTVLQTSSSNALGHSSQFRGEQILIRKINNLRRLEFIRANARSKEGVRFEIVSESTELGDVFGSGSLDSFRVHFAEG